MKKSIIAVFAGLVSAAVFADVSDNVVVSFSTPGTDRYADNSQVEEKECYAVVWTPADSEFAGINADGEAVAPSKVVLIAPIASGGKCPSVTYTIDGTYVSGITGGKAGTWSVYLLDTRKYAADENGEIITDEGGNKILESLGTIDKSTGKFKGVVNGYGVVATLSGSNMSSASAGGSVSVSTASALPENALNLKIDDIQIYGDNVYIYVKGSRSSLQYELKSGDSPSSLAVAPADGNPQYGKDGDEENMLFIRTKKPGAQFFKVNRK